MPSKDKMTVDERRKYLKLVVPRYAKASRRERSGLLTEMASVTGLHRKSLLRLLHRPSLERAPKRPRLRRRRYGAAVADVVRVVWESLDYVCAERLTPALLVAAQQLAQWEELVLTQALEAQLATISPPEAGAAVAATVRAGHPEVAAAHAAAAQPGAARRAHGTAVLGHHRTGQL